jgi:membrane associated rhomboid family serine protease
MSSRHTNCRQIAPNFCRRRLADSRPEARDLDILPDGWDSVFDSASRGACLDRALVLHALGISYEIISVGQRSVLVVPEELAEKAKYELWQYDQENRKPKPRGAGVKPVYESGVPGVATYVAIICLVAWFAGEALFNRDWFVVGRVDGELIRDGEWWRTITALTLHAGARHLAGNIVFGILFGLMAGRLIGSGVAWFGIVVASGAANFLNISLLESTHRAIGASTAVFAALGLVSGFVWRAKLMAQDRWPYRLGPIVGGIALLAYTGTGDANTDIGAHLAGFVCGFLAGMALTLAATYLRQRSLQLGAGIAAVSIIVFAWLIALSFWA